MLGSESPSLDGNTATITIVTSSLQAVRIPGRQRPQYET